MVLSNTFSLKKNQWTTVAEQFDVLLSQIDKHDFEELDRTLSEDSASHSAQFPVACARDMPTPIRDTPTPIPANIEPSNKPGPSIRFALKTDEELKQAKTNAIPKNTLKNTTWAVKMWKQWSAHRKQVYPGEYGEWPVHPFIANDHQLDYWLSKFVLEARRSDGNPYPPNTLYQIYCGLMRFVRDRRPEVNLFKGNSFIGFRRALDGEMKRLRSNGYGVARKQAEPLTIGEENQLWEKGALGDHSPQVLLDTVLLLCGINFALRSGEEHRSLQTTQFKLVEPVNGTPYLIYYENSSKNNAGGLSDRKVEPKCVTHYANDTNPHRCLVVLYKKYLEHRPDMKETAFYLTPLRNPRGKVWFSKTPVGHNTLAKTVARICRVGGVEGYKTNHSLRVTTATRLFQSGIDEQLIMDRTGHRSVDGVRTYKRISEDKKKHTSKILNAATNCETELTHDENSASTQICATQASTHPGQTSHSLPLSLHLTGCSSVNINYYIASN